MQLSRNFSLQELTKSDTAIRKGIDNKPNADQIEKLKALCENILQPVRDQFGRVKVTSGYRSLRTVCSYRIEFEQPALQKLRPSISNVWELTTLKLLIGLK